MQKENKNQTVLARVLIIIFVLMGLIISYIASKNPVLTYPAVAVAKERVDQAKEEIRIAYGKTQYGYWKEWEKDDEIDKEEFFMKDDRFENDMKNVSGKRAESTVTLSGNEFYVVYKALDTNETFNFKIDSNGNISELNKRK